MYSTAGNLLNQVHAGHRPELAWFLKVVSVRMSVFLCVYVCVCARVYVYVFAYVYVCACPEAINN